MDIEPSSRTREVLGETNVHLDFHTPAFQPEVGADFDPDRFADRLVEANVDSVTLFGKCCHASSYYDTVVGQRHPTLGYDLLERQIDACHERGITTPVYYTLAWDNGPGEENPDWYQRDGDGNPLNATDRDDRWEYLCLNSPYTEEVILPQVRELLEYDVDGFFFDILLYHEDACTCRYCRAGMTQKGLDPDDPEDRRQHRFETCRRFADRCTRIVKEHDEELVVTYNHRLDLGLTSALEGTMDYVTIESLPSGWGYMHTPTYARYARNLSRPAHGMTGAFHKVWGDFGTVKGEAQLQYELANSTMHGIPVSVGDQLLPRGELEPGKYDVVGEAFAHAKARLPDPDERAALSPVRDVAVVVPGHHDPAGGDAGMNPDDPEMAVGGAVAAAKLLCDTHRQFDVLDEPLAEALLGEFRVAVLPDVGPLSASTVEAIREFVAGGGSLLATGNSSLGDGDLALGDVLGVTYEGRLPYSTAYLATDRYDDGPLEECVSYGPFHGVAPDGAAVEGRVVAPTTERSETRRFSHYQAPPERTLDAPAITRHGYGDGEAVYLAADLVGQYYAEGYRGHRALLDDVLDGLHERVLDADAPTSVEVNAMTTGARTYLHATNFHAGRAGASMPRIDEAVPARDVTVRLRDDGDVDAGAVSALTDAPVETERDGDALAVTFGEVPLHEVAVVDHG